jgi:hypothetical protein
MASTPEVYTDTKADLAAELLRYGGSVLLKARGTSMLPSVWPDDLLTIQGVAYGEVAAGDVVLVLRDHRFFVHRLVGFRRGQDCLLWVTRGDAMPHDDPPAAASEVLGRVANIRRGNCSFVPRRRVTLFHCTLAWMLCRWDRFRNLALRIHGIFQSADLSTPEFFRDAFGATRRAPNSHSRTSHP